jgi:hypothetical protein
MCLSLLHVQALLMPEQEANRCNSRLKERLVATQMRPGVADACNAYITCYALHLSELGAYGTWVNCTY